MKQNSDNYNFINKKNKRMKSTIKFLVISIALLSGFQSQSQILNYADIKTERPGGKITQYISKDGAIYKVGDTITLGKGSGANGSFLYIQGQNMYAEIYNLDASMYNTKAIIKEFYIMGNKKEGWKVACKTKGSFVQNPLIFIVENAIANGELKSFGMTSDEALTELKKCKDKLDLGLITKEEFEKKKAELSKYIK
jgi:hypothetical protein